MEGVNWSGAAKQVSRNPDAKGIDERATTRHPGSEGRTPPQKIFDATHEFALNSCWAGLPES
jgi:hypothetical protein